jgi:5-methylthioadenosine/S-adenosylhomocysteine deaminase
MTFDLVLKNGSIICMDEQRRVLEQHAIGIIGNKIADIFPLGSHSYTAKAEIDADNCLLIPGLINAHSHLPMTYFRGLADDLPLQDWLQNHIWPLEAKLVNETFVYDACLHGAAEMLRNGITCSNDMYFHMAAIADAGSKAGLRVIVSEALIDPPDRGDKYLQGIGTKVREMKQRYLGNQLVDFSLAPHAIYTCSKATLIRCAEVAAKEGFLIHLHLSETETEVLNCIAEHGLRPVAYLESLGLLDVPAVFAHGIWVDDAEMQLLAKHGNSSIAICTESNLKLTSGFAPIARYQQHGINYCLATDGVASNNDLDLLAELSITAKLHKTLNNNATFLPAKQAFAGVTIDAAKAIGKADEIGSIESGKLADIVVIKLDELGSQPIYNPYSHLVYAANSCSVRDVIVNGTASMLNGELCHVNEADLLATATSYRTLIQEQ